MRWQLLKSVCSLAVPPDCGANVQYAMRGNALDDADLCRCHFRVHVPAVFGALCAVRAVRVDDAGALALWRASRKGHFNSFAILSNLLTVLPVFLSIAHFSRSSRCACTLTGYASAYIRPLSRRTNRRRHYHNIQIYAFESKQRADVRHLVPLNPVDCSADCRLFQLLLQFEQQQQ